MAIYRMRSGVLCVSVLLLMTLVRPTLSSYTWMNEFYYFTRFYMEWRDTNAHIVKHEWGRVEMNFTVSNIIYMYKRNLLTAYFGTCRHRGGTFRKPKEWVGAVHQDWVSLYDMKYYSWPSYDFMPYAPVRFDFKSGRQLSMDVWYFRTHKVINGNFTIFVIHQLDFIGWAYGAGILSYLAWGASLYMQIALNYVLKNVEGLSPGYLMNYFCAHLFIGGYSHIYYNDAEMYEQVLLNHWVHEATCYHLTKVNDFFVHIYKQAPRYYYPIAFHPVQASELVYYVHQVFIISLTMYQYCLYGENPRLNIFKLLSSCGGTLGAVGAYVAFLISISAIQEASNWRNTMTRAEAGYVAPMVFTICIVLMYIPQIELNAKILSSEGWSIAGSTTHLCGSVLYMIRLFIIGTNFGNLGLCGEDHLYFRAAALIGMDVVMIGQAVSIKVINRVLTGEDNLPPEALLKKEEEKVLTEEEKRLKEEEKERKKAEKERKKAEKAEAKENQKPLFARLLQKFEAKPAQS